MKNVIKPSVFAKKIGVSITTLRRWDNSGRLKAHRTLGGQRFYTSEDYDNYMEGAYAKGH